MSGKLEGRTSRLARFVCDTSYDDVTPEALHESKRMLLDSIGCALGALGTESGTIGLDFASELGGHPTTTVVGGGKTSPTAAAYANARLGGVLDADDTFPSLGHFGNSTSFTALAMAEHLGRTGRELVTAIAVGFDVGARICNAVGLPFAVQDGRVVGYTDRGGGSHSIAWSTVGAATSLAMLDVERTAHAFGIAGANTPLPSLRDWAGLTDLPMFKVADPGWISQMSISATLLAARGSTGYDQILDRDMGFWRFFGSDALDENALWGGLGAEWRILDTTYKPWPSCRWNHYPLTAFETLRDRHGLAPSDIEKIVVRAAPFAVSPRFHVNQPTTMINAEFSHAHTIAMSAFNVPVGPLWYSAENMHGAKIKTFRDLVSVETEPTAANIGQWVENGQFRKLPGGVDVHVRGMVLSETAQMAGGDPWSEITRFTDEKLKSKFRSMVLSSREDRDGRYAEWVEKIITTVYSLEEVKDVGALTSLLAIPF